MLDSTAVDTHVKLGKVDYVHIQLHEYLLFINIYLFVHTVDGSQPPVYFK